MNTRQLIETRLTPAQLALSDLWDPRIRSKCATKGTRAAVDTMMPDAYVNQVADGAFERRFCGVLIALMWVITSFVIVFVF